MKKILCVFGTRPEAIKMAPIILKLRNDTHFELKICITAQHRDMLDGVLDIYGIYPDYDLNIMREGQQPTYVTETVLDGVNRIVDSFKPDMITVHGDTSSALAAALAGFYRGVTVCHIEAGLRSGDILSPFPEEFNRRVIALASKYHFAPTERAAENLIKEGVRAENIFTVGNTVIDALVMSADMQVNTEIPRSPFILMTVHRREHTDEAIRSIFKGVTRICKEFERLKVIYPVHKSPRIRRIAQEMLGDIPAISLTEPLPVTDFHNLLRSCHFVLTDSGGIQEEAAFLGKPTLVARENTERIEALEGGPLRLIGTDSERIYSECRRLLTDKNYYAGLSCPSCIYGKGDSAGRIVEILRSL